VLTIPVLLGVATLVFSLIHLIPGDPAQAMLGEGASEADVVQLRRQLGLDRPLAEQYFAFLVGLARADLGTSLRTGTPVLSQIVERMPATLELAAAAMIVALAIAIPLGILAAVWRGTLVDHTAMTLSLVGVSMPNFWLGPLLAIVFAVELGWLPVSGRGGVGHLVLPAVSLGAALSKGERVRRFVNIAAVAQRKLRQLQIAGKLDDLRVPPGNRLEALKGDRLGQHSIRINDQWRVCFRWTEAGAEDVEIVDYH